MAQKLVASAELVVGGKRHLGLAKMLIRGRTLAWPSPIGDALPEIEKHRGRPVVVLASGDPFHYGVGDLLLRSIPAAETLCLPNASAFSLAAARLGWSLQDVALVSLHGRALEGIVRHLQPGARILALSWDGETPAKLATFLAERGMGSSELTVLEAMGGPSERVRSTTAAGFDLADIAPLNTIALHVAAAADATVLPLDAGPRRHAVRARRPAHQARGPRRHRVGTGAAPGRAFVGCRPGRGLGRHRMAAASSLAQGDRHRSGASSARRARPATPPCWARPILQIVQKRAPEAFAGLPSPDAVFLGGGLSNPGLFEAAWTALKPGGRLVANAVSIQSEARLIEYFQRHGGELVRLEVSKAGKAGTGGVFVWRAAAPIVQWRARKP